MKEKTIQKARELYDARIQFVSLVNAAANKRKFLVTKARDGTHTFTGYGKILKADPKAHYVTGIVYEPMAEDTDGEFMTAAEIQKAAYYYVKNFENVDIQHNFEPEKSCTVVESWIAKSDFTLGGQTVKEGTWLMTVEVLDDDLWGKIEKGEITGFSMGGVAKKKEEDVELEGIQKDDVQEEKKSLLAKLAEFMGLSQVKKGEVAEVYEEQMQDNAFDNAMAALGRALRFYDPREDKFIFEHDEEKIRLALEDFQNIILNLLTENVEVEKTQTEKEVNEVTKEEMKTIVEEAVAKAMKAEKETDAGKAKTEAPEAQVEKAEAADQKEEQAQPMEEVLAKAVNGAIDDLKKSMGEMVAEEVKKAMEPVLKASRLPSNLNDETVAKEAQEVHYLHGIL